jgi:hypothetical protein
VVLLVSLLLTAQSGDELICPQLGSARDEKWGGGWKRRGKGKGGEEKKRKVGGFLFVLFHRRTAESCLARACPSV